MRRTPVIVKYQLTKEKHIIKLKLVDYEYNIDNLLLLCYWHVYKYMHHKYGKIVFPGWKMATFLSMIINSFMF